MEDPGLSKFYKESNLGVIKNKYTYYLAVQIGAPYDLMFPDLFEVHEKISSKNESPISSTHFDQMKKFFFNALQNQEIDEDDSSEFMQLIISYEP